jgi:hypothetical protein
LKCRTIGFAALLALGACGRSYDTSAIEAQSLDLTGDDPGLAQSEALDKLDEQKAMWLTRYWARAGNCHQLTKEGLARMNAVVQPGDHYRGETTGGTALVDHAHCVKKANVIPIDDPQFGQPLAQTVGDAIRQQKKIEDAFRAESGDRRWGEGDGHDDRAVNCSENGQKIACAYAE